MPIPKQVQVCVDNQVSSAPQKAKALIPQMRRYRMDFIFDGQNCMPTPASAALAKRLDLP
jgi:hypothetical protein